jgi:hypothetical protein
VNATLSGCLKRSFANVRASFHTRAIYHATIALMVSLERRTRRPRPRAQYFQIGLVEDYRVVWSDAASDSPDADPNLASYLRDWSVCLVVPGFLEGSDERSDISL